MLLIGQRIQTEQQSLLGGSNMNVLNVNDIIKERLKGKTLVNLEFSDPDGSGRSEYYGSVIIDVGTGLDESGEDPVIWLYFEDGDIYAYLNETITVE